MTRLCHHIPSFKRDHYSQLIPHTIDEGIIFIFPEYHVKIMNDLYLLRKNLPFLGGFDVFRGGLVSSELFHSQNNIVEFFKNY